MKRSPSRNPLLGYSSSCVSLTEQVNQAKKQHNLGISLLKELGLDYVRLERKRDGLYRYHAWSVPLVDDNGSPRISRRGLVQQHQIS
jgi:hypothetical protein